MGERDGVAGAGAKRSPGAQQPEIVAVLFDAVGTVLYADPPVADAYQAIAARFGSRLTTDEIRDRFRHALTRPERDGQATSEAVEQSRWRRIVAEVINDIPASASEQLFAELWQHFAQPTSWRLFDDVAPTWTELTARGYLLGVASNFDSRLRTVLAGLPPLDRCQHLFISSEIGYPKPDARFFQAVEQTLSLPPSQILLVGDDWTNDIVGGQSAGWSTAWLERESSSSTAPSIKQLTELLPQLPPR